MRKLNEFIKTSLLGGIVVILPVAILIFAFKWIFEFVTDIIQPLTNLIMKLTVQSGIQEVLADLTAISIIVVVCFFVGVFIRTKVGTYIYHNIENRILRAAPGYSLVKETVIQFLGTKKAPFSRVALVRLFSEGTLVSAFVTEEHSDGSYTIFVPTAPNPTSGYVVHVERQYVRLIDVPVEDVMKSIISCGAGSTKLVKAQSEINKGKDSQGTHTEG
jgi:uncharacterized membrane protein